MHNKKTSAIIMALLAAVFYSVGVPFSKLLLNFVQPVFMSAFLYLGAGVGIGALYLILPGRIRSRDNKLTRAELPYTVGMIVLDIAAPICLMLGLMSTTAANASLLNNFEIVATSVIALFIFKEVISPRLWAAILLITLASLLLSFEDISSLQFSYGSLFVLAACVCWGFENNCTRRMSSKSAYQIVTIKGLCSGTGSFIIALITGETLPALKYMLAVLLVGFISYGLSIFLYVRAQNELGAAKTSAFYAVAPFIGALLSCLMLHESPGCMYYIALSIMLAGAALTVYDTLRPVRQG